MSGLKILTSGNLSGIGRYIYENLGGRGLNRATTKKEFEKLKMTGVDVIIHCAFNSSRDVNNDSLYGYYSDNVLLTSELVRIPHKKFILFSTVDLYRKGEGVSFEDEVVDVDSVKGIYAVTKLISEAIVKNRCPDNLILRPTTLVGRYARRNTFMRLVSEETGNLYLSGDSVFNYVLHSDICGFIEKAIRNDIRGTFNVASSGNIRLSEVARTTGSGAKFGEHRYDVGNISNEKITNVFPAFNKTSKDVLKEFMGENAHV